MRSKPYILAACCLALSLVSPGKRAGASEASLSGLSWLVGSWESARGSMTMEEHWIAEAGKTMLGVSRTVVRGRTVGFEFLRLEEREDGIVYIAHPNARTGTEFKLTHSETQAAVFENPAHDHPKIIRYRRNADGTLHAQIEGDEKGKRVVQDFHFRRK